MKDKKLIKVINPNKAGQLASLGFSYISEKINNKEVFCFIATPELLKHLQSNFDKCDFLMENTLRF
ncbi:MAG: hypothetical protein RR806_03190 [Oscillospiraceae bacterium]